MKVYSVLLIIVLSLTTNSFSQVDFTPHTITTSADYANSVYAVDVNGDGVLTCSPKTGPFIMRVFSLTCIMKEVQYDATKQIYTGADRSDLKPVGEWDIDR